MTNFPEILPGRPRTVPELLAAATAAGPADPFLLWGEDSWTTFAEFELAARRFAGALHSRGIAKGDRVAILMDNRPEFLTAAYGSMLIGALFVSINTALTASEATYIAGHSGARVLVSEPRHLALVEEISTCSGPEFVVLAPPNDTQPAGGAIRWADFLADPIAPATVEVRGEDLAVIQYTSGTTASPKGALLTQESLVSAFRTRARHLRYDAAETMLVTGPLFHLNAQSVVMMGLVSHFRVVLREKFSASRFWGDVKRHGVTTLNGMQAISRILLARDPEPDERPNPLRTVVGILTPELHRAFEERFGVTFVPVYGLTEDPMPVLGPRDGLPPEWSGKIAASGRPVEPEVHQILIVDDEGRRLPPGARGEIVKRSPNMMKGYYKDPEATAAALRDGWLHTGDLGTLDEDGFLYVVGRKKDAIRRSGEMIAAAEVETAMASHPAVAEVAVVGVDDAVRGEEVKAFLVLAGDRTHRDVSPEEIFEHCSKRLASFKIPRYLAYRRDLPKTATLKVRKDALRVAETAAADVVFDRQQGRS